MRSDNLFKTYIEINKLNWRASKRLILLNMLNAFASAFRAIINIYLPKLIIEDAAAGISSNTAIYIAAIIISNAFLMKLPGYTNAAIKQGVGELIDRYFYFMNRKTLELSFSQLEDPKISELKNSAYFMLKIMSAPVRLMIKSVVIFSSLFIILAVTASVINLSGVLLLILTVALILQSIVSYFGLRKVRKNAEETEKSNRYFFAYIHPVYDKDINMDIRLYNMQDFVRKRIDINNLTLKKNKRMKISGIMLGTNNVINVIAVAAAYVYVGVRTLSTVWGPQLNLAEFAFYISAFTLLNSRLGEFTQAVGDLSASLANAKPICEYLNLQPAGKEQHYPKKMPAKIEKIEIEDLHFTYPGGDFEVLKGLSMTIEGSEKISLVGLNGSGKTTLVKLLCRFYEPSSGRILLNGIDIRRFDLDEYRAALSVIFQDYQLFNLTLAENVAANLPLDRQKILNDLKRAGFKKPLQENSTSERDLTLNSLLAGKTGEGVRLSGGESQKVAIARALYRDSDFIILDEPTSALDPQSEAEIYESFNSLVDEKPAVYISHRMSSSIFCDKIYVLQDGVISEEGSHLELMQEKGLYYKLFKVQEENYAL